MSTTKPQPLHNPDFDQVDTVYPFSVRDLDGHPVKLEKYIGYVCIFVNVASYAGIYTTHNYKVLNELHEKYADKGLRILAFPCNQFHNQEPDSNKEIKRFIKGMEVRFDVFGKNKVNCDNSHPLWKFLKMHAPNPYSGGKWMPTVIKEPFTKFVVDRAGVPVARLPPGAKEDEIIQIIEPLLEPKTEKEKENQLEVQKSDVKVELPPPIVKEEKPCSQPWHFESGIKTLT